jgi:hypothetical protein
MNAAGGGAVFFGREGLAGSETRFAGSRDTLGASRPPIKILFPLYTYKKYPQLPALPGNSVEST